MISVARPPTSAAAPAPFRQLTTASAGPVDDEVCLDRNYPLARWWLRPLAARAAQRLAPTAVRPNHVTLLGALLAGTAATAVGCWPTHGGIAAVLVLAYWFCDRTDGLLARRQRSTSAAGAWLDANVDEAVDVGLHAAAAWSLAAQSQAAWPVWLWAGLVSGKYLLMYGLHAEEAFTPTASVGGGGRLPSPSGRAISALRDVYHLPANADVRVHALALALAGNGMAFELAFFAAYYHARWIVRYGLVGWRLRRDQR